MARAPRTPRGRSSKQVDALKEGQAALQKELQQIKALLTARPAAQQ